MDNQSYTTIRINPSIVSSLSWDNLRSFFISVAFILMDYLAIVAAALTAFFIRAKLIPLFHDNLIVPDVFIYVIIPAAFMLFLHFDRKYINKLYFWQQAARLFKASLYAMLLTLVVLFFSGSVKEVSRIFTVLLWFFSFGYLAIGRYFFKKMVMNIGALQAPTILVGAGKTAELLLESFRKNGGSGYKIVGLIEDQPQKSCVAGRYPVLGTFAQAETIVQNAGVKHVLIAAPGLIREELLDLVYRLQPYVNHVTFVPDLLGVPVGSMELDTLFNEKTVLLRIKNNLSQIHNRALKLLFDCFCTIIGVALVAPLCFLIGVIIYLDSPGPVIFAHKRVGYKGKKFPCYKFRTMVNNSREVLEQYLRDNPVAREEWERDFKLKDDPRVTKIGRFLRKTSLDELPQFLNVLKGEMSLVGPRPIVDVEVERYGKYINDYYLVRPGITGIWQVSGRNDVGYSERVEMDSWYVRNWSLWLDIILLIKTVGIVLKRKGAY